MSTPDLSSRLSSLTPAQRALLDLALRKKAQETLPPPAVTPASAPVRGIPPREQRNHCPLSLDQERLWFIQQLDLTSPIYNIYSAHRHKGPLDTNLLRQALNIVVARHEALRTTFPAIDGRPVQEIAPALEAPTLLVDLRGLRSLPLEVREEEAYRATMMACREPFDLTRLPLFRNVLIQMDEEDFIQPITIHHIITDRVSAYIFENEVAELYRLLLEGRPPVLPEPDIQSADFAVWQRERLRDEAFVAEHIAYWREKLADAPELSTLPPDRPRPAIQSPWGGRRRIALTRSQAEAFKRFSKDMDVTMFVAGLAIWTALLVRLSGQEKMVVGTPMNYRQVLDLPHVLGFYLNQIPLYTDLGGDPTFREILDRTRATALGAYAHHDLPFAKIVDTLRPGRDLSRVPYTQAVFLLLDPPQQGWASMPGIESRPYWIDAQRIQFDLNMALFWVEDTGLTGMLEYNAALFDVTTMDRVKEQFRMLLVAVLEDPDRRLSELPLLNEAQRHQVVYEWGSARGGFDSSAPSLHNAFESHAARHPGAIAVTCDGAALTYGDLNQKADRLARRLLALGVKSDRIALAAERGLDMVAGILGILKAGCAYVPIDPKQPADRLAFLLADCGAPVLLADAASRDAFPGWPGRTLSLEDESSQSWPSLPSFPAAPTTPAYVIYTSGSTGQPKGVVVTHANVLRLFSATDSLFHFDRSDVWTLFHSFAFDFSVWELWGALLYGGRLAVVPYWVSRSPRDFARLLAEERVTVLNQTPKAFRQLIPEALADGAPDLSALRWVVFGGEALSPRSLAPWVERFGDGTDGRGPGFVNMYGITETTVHVTWHRVLAREVESGWESRIGRPIPDLSLFVLDPHGQPVPIHVAGELCVGGPGLAQGYLGRPALTAERFVPDPWSPEPGARLYRSGDLGRFRAEGDLEYLRRADQQVKVRGFRIELGEIEAALATHPRVGAAAVLALPSSPEDDGSGDLRLVAYVVGVEWEAPKTEELRAHLAGRLPEHMVPAVFVPLPALPLTANGKLDRAALPAPGVERPDLAAAYAPPETPAEQALAVIWAELLGLEKVGIHDNFFSLGGDSIVSLRVVALAAKQGLTLTLQDIFRHQTISAIAENLIGSTAERPVTVTDRGAFSLLSLEDRERLSALDPEGELEDAYPLTQLQAGMLYHMALTPEEPLYHNVGTFHLRGHLEQAAFRQAVDQVTARHPVMRTSFALTGFGEPLQLVHRAATVPIEVEDWQSLSPAEQDAAAARQAAIEKTRRFDLTKAPQMRFHIARRSPSTFQLTLVENHAIFDGWSLNSTLAEIFETYFRILRGEALPAPVPPALPFREYIRLEREALVSPEATGFWNGVLADLPPAELPTWPAGPTPGRRVRTRRALVPGDTFAALKDLARRAGVPVKSVLLGAHLRVLSHLTGRPGVVTGLVTNGRLEESGGDETRGLFLNTLPLGWEASTGTWLDLARQAFQAEEALLPFRRYPFAALQRQAGDRPLYEVAFNYVHFHVARGLAESGDLEVLGLEMIEGANFKLLVSFAQAPSGDGLACDLEYDSHVLPDAQAAVIADLYLRCLAALAADPGGSWEEASLFSEAERHQLRTEWNDTAPAPRIDVVARFEAQAVRTPAAVALTWEGGEIPYWDLDERANRLARYLIETGAVPAPETPIGVFAERGPDLAVAFLAVLKAGGVYLPLDPAQPFERLEVMLEDAGCSTLLTGGGAAAPLADSALPLRRIDLRDEEAWSPDGTPLDLPIPLDQLAYIVYTSGSTGRPKGIGLPHRLLANLVSWQIEATPAPDLRTLQLGSPGFDVSVQETQVTWCAGGTVVAAPEEARRDPAALARLLSEARIERLYVTFVVLQQLAEHLDGAADLPLSLREVITAGERLQATPPVRALLRRLPGCVLRNQYGPSETHVVTEHILPIDPEGWPALPPIGRPIAGTRAFVVDAAFQPVPAGVPGELLLGGENLARGYVGRPDWTAARFVPDSLSGDSGARLYCTGDLTRFLPDGAIEFLGRIDHQVKIRGYRVEPEEIEATLLAHPAVHEAAVIALTEDGVTRLVAFAVVDPLPDLPVELRHHLSHTLPAYMVPSAFVTLEALPLTRTGKVDRRALPALAEGATGQATAAEYVPPATPIEKALAEIFEEVLRIEKGRVGLRDNFFDLGGHSLLATRVMALLQDRTGIDLPMRTLFEATDLEDLAQRVIEQEVLNAPDDLLEELAAGKEG